MTMGGRVDMSRLRYLYIHKYTCIHIYTHGRLRLASLFIHTHTYIYTHIFITYRLGVDEALAVEPQRPPLRAGGLEALCTLCAFVCLYSLSRCVARPTPKIPTNPPTPTKLHKPTHLRVVQIQKHPVDHPQPKGAGRHHAFREGVEQGGSVRRVAGV